MADDGRPVYLYVYDLSQGIARMYSRALLGTHIDAVYHTSIVLETSEFYYGQGIQVSSPGQTHYGEPMEKIPMGNTHIPDEVVLEYLESMKSIYSPERYNLFLHNCNNFTNDFSMFLTGRNIPSHITSLPETVLNSEGGRLFLGHLGRTGTGAIAPAQPVSQGIQITPSAGASAVRTPTNLTQFQASLAEAMNSSAVVFFTSATCAPCRALYPLYEQKAKDLYGRVVFIKVDIGVATDVGSEYQISATPTFMTFCKGEKVEEWRGGDRGQLEAKLQLLVHITYPPHPHTKYDLSITLSTPMTPILYPKLPPFEKVLAKLGSVGTSPGFSSMITFLRERQRGGPREAPLPDLNLWASFMRDSFATLDRSALLFPVVDILRATLVDPRVSGWFATETVEPPDEKTVVRHLVNAILTDPTAGINFTSRTSKPSAAPYALRLVTLQGLCNLFSSPISPAVLCREPLIVCVCRAVETSLVDATHVAARVAASSLVFNLATYVQKHRATQNEEVLHQRDIAKLIRCVVYAVEKESDDAGCLKALLVAGLLLVYCMPLRGEVSQVLKDDQAGRRVREKGTSAVGRRFRVGPLCEEVARVLEYAD